LYSEQARRVAKIPPKAVQRADLQLITPDDVKNAEKVYFGEITKSDWAIQKRLVRL
jgi:hypothetical protein